MTPARPLPRRRCCWPERPIPLSSLLASTLVSNYSQEAIDVFFDATSKLTLRGGYRYVWGDALLRLLAGRRVWPVRIRSSSGKI